MHRAILFVLFLSVVALFTLVTSPLVGLLGLISIPGMYAGNKYFTRVFLLYDQGINVIFHRQLNYIFNNPSYPFGDEDETISSVIGKNLRDRHNNLRSTQRAFRWCDKWLTWLDPSATRSHSLEAIEEDESF